MSARGTRRPGWALLLATALVAAACADDGDRAGDEAATTTAAATATTAAGATTTAPSDGGVDPSELTASFRGVTEDSIRIGVAMIDLEQLADAGFIEFSHGDLERSYQAVIDHVNENGGVLGRRLEPVYRTFLPIGATEGEAMCLEFTEDAEVFAVVGSIPGLIPTVIECIVGTHETIHVGHGLSAELVERYQGLLVTPDILAERRFAALLSVLEETGELDGATVAVFGDGSVAGRVEDTVVPGLASIGLDPVEVALVDTTSADLNQISDATRILAERFRVAGVDTVYGVGAVAPTLFPVLASVLPGLRFVTEEAGALRQAAQSSADPGPFEGALSLDGLNEDSGEQFTDPRMQECIARFTSRNPDIEVLNPGEVERGGAKWSNGIRDACNELEVFVRAAEAAGPNLTNETWIAGLESLGDGIELYGKPYASFGPGKFDADDSFRLVRFSVDVGENGGFVELGDVVDVSG